jgi:Swiss Army Knife RNA repair-like protein
MNKYSISNTKLHQLSVKPLLFVDIDGVLSLWGFGMDEWPNDGAWHQIDGMSHFLSARAARNLLGLCTTFDPVWCSGWEEKADDYLPHLLGLPRFPHLTFERNPGRELTHWKLPAIDSYAENRSIAWIDDAFNEACFAWAAERSAPTLLVQTQPTTGLDDAAAEELKGWALSRAAAAPD